VHAIAVAVPLFVLGTVVSLTASWVLVSRIERFGERFHLSEALLGLIAALAADAPEITSSVSAVLDHQRSVGAGVVLGSNLFNLAALLGLAGVLAGTIALHRSVVLFAGGVSLAVALLCVLAVSGALPAAAALVLVLVVLGAYGAALGLDVRGLQRLRLPRGWCAWLCLAVGDEDLELRDAMPPPGRRVDAVVATAALVAVVAASVVMERSASALGQRFDVPGIVVGGLALAAVTSLPNAVAAVYLARRGRGTAVLSTALNSNAINVAFGLLVPGVLLGLGPASSPGTLVACWYVALTLVALGLVFARRALARLGGWAIIAGYLAFVVSLLGVSARPPSTPLELVPIAPAVLVAGAAALARRGAGPGRGRPAGPGRGGRRPSLPGQRERRLS
jgi:cation:H+ antiporter